MDEKQRNTLGVKGNLGIFKNFVDALLGEPVFYEALHQGFKFLFGYILLGLPPGWAGLKT